MVLKNGPDADGYFYIDGIKQKAYQLIEFEGDYYLIWDYNKYMVNRSIDLSEKYLVGTPLVPWHYQFGADGKMIGYMREIINGRDIGDVPYYKTTEGYDIKSGLIIRGSELDGVETGISKEDAQLGIDLLVNKYGIKFDMDLRAANYPELGVEDVFDEDVEHKYYGMVFYADVFTERGKTAIKNIFVDLSNPDNYPIYMHCAQGIDRTGIVTYILGAMLGVPEGYLANEYMLSVGAYGNQILVIRDGLRTYEGATLQECAEAYLLDCGVTMEQIESIRDILLEK